MRSIAAAVISCRFVGVLHNYLRTYTLLLNTEDFNFVVNSTLRFEDSASICKRLARNGGQIWHYNSETKQEELRQKYLALHVAYHFIFVHLFFVYARCQLASHQHASLFVCHILLSSARVNTSDAKHTELYRRFQKERLPRTQNNQGVLALIYL